MYGAIITAAASLFGNALQSKAQQDAMNRQTQALDQERARQTSFYTRRYYEDATQRADTSRILNRARNTFMQSNRAASGKAAVMGSTNAEVAAQKEANANAYANTVSQVAASAEDRKDKLDDNYNNMMHSINETQRNLNAQNDFAHAQAVGQMANQVAQIGASTVANEPAKPTGYNVPAVGNNSAAVTTAAQDMRNKFDAANDAWAKSNYSGISSLLFK